MVEKKNIPKISFQKIKHYVLNRILTFNGDAQRKDEEGGHFEAS